MIGSVRECSLGVGEWKINDWIREKVVCGIWGKICLSYEGNRRYYDFKVG